MTTKEETQSKIDSEGEQKDKVATNHHVVGGRGRAGEVVDADHGASITVELVDYIRGLLQQVVVVSQEVSPHLPSHGLVISPHAKTTGTQPQPRAGVGQINPRADDDEPPRRGGGRDSGGRVLRRVRIGGRSCPPAYSYNPWVMDRRREYLSRRRRSHG
jgi:hypothetical protein